MAGTECSPPPSISPRSMKAVLPSGGMLVGFRQAGPSLERPVTATVEWWTHGRRRATARRSGPTHEVVNQPPPLEPYNVFEQDRVLVEALAARGRRLGRDRARAVGESRRRGRRWGRLGQREPPVLRTHDRYGNRIDEVEFHPAWHELMRLGDRRTASTPLPWREPRPGAHVARAALFMMLAQAEAGHGCPISMTYSAIPALRAQPELAEEWEPRLTSTRLRPALRAGGREGRRAAAGWR